MSVGGSHGRSHETACGADSSACLCVSSQCVNLSAGSRSMQSLRRVDPSGPAWTVDARTANARRVAAVDESVRLSTLERSPFVYNESMSWVPRQTAVTRGRNEHEKKMNG